ncbi:hypothetical protein [Niveibacterium sp. COAC-50]|uniref:hypothetical protein n=1 Tax=Niveibacterium sp. COAC-50 TaxID=2729384 RepID=UPI0015531F1E|nr:hypothetical protein [Niveibacterium sp. COAC-50]
MILVLDFNDVLHGTGDDAELNRAAGLAILLAQFLQVDVVTSTSCRLGQRLGGLSSLLPPKLA